VDDAQALHVDGLLGATESRAIRRMDDTDSDPRPFLAKNLDYAKPDRVGYKHKLKKNRRK
jgi:hypothetical protein